MRAISQEPVLLRSRGYVYVNRLLGVALATFTLLFVRDGMGLFGVSLG